MSTFDDFIQTAKNAAATVGRKATTAINSAEIQNKRNRALENIGRLYYDTCKNGVDHAEEISLLVESVDNYTSALEKINDEENSLKNEIECKVCGKMNNANANFCSNCSAKLK